MYNFIWSEKGFYYALENHTIRADREMNVYGGGDTTVEAPEPTSQELALMQAQLDILNQSRAENALLAPYILQSLGLVQENGQYRRMSEEERIANMTPTELKNYEILQLQQERYLKALKGELPVSPALEQDLATQKRITEENLSRRLGSDWSTSTPGIQTESEFNQRAEALREMSRRDEITSGQGLLLAQQGFMTGENQAELQGYQGYGQRLFPLVQGYGQAQQPYQFNRNMQFQANVANAQQGGGLLGGLGSLIGAGLGAYGTYAGLKSLT